MKHVKQKIIKNKRTSNKQIKYMLVKIQFCKSSKISGRLASLVWFPFELVQVTTTRQLSLHVLGILLFT